MSKKHLTLLNVLITFILFFLNTSPIYAATIGPWQASPPYATDVSSHPLPSFIAGSYYYVLLYNRNITYAKINSNGSLGNWQTASTQHNEGSGRGYTAVVIGNAPYLLRFGRVEKLVIDSSSGNVTAINQVGSASGGNDSVGGNYYYWNSAVSAIIGTNAYVFHLGGFDCCQTPHYGTNNQIYRSNNTSSNSWQWQSAGNGAYRNPYKAVFYNVTGQNFGFIYASDLNQEKNPNPLYRIKVKSDGNMEGGWINTGNLPDKASGNDHAMGDIFVIDSSLFVIRGSKVYQTTINSDGSISSWNDNPPDLPEIQINKAWSPSVDGDHTDGSSHGIYNNYVYVTGINKVYYSQINGSLQPTLTPTSAPSSPTPSVTNTPNPTPTPSPTRTPNATITPTPTIAPPTSTPYPTTASARLPKTPPDPYPQGPYCPNSSGCAGKGAGDANCDGVVNDADYSLWLPKYDSMTAGLSQSQNPNFSCTEGNSTTYFVDFIDYEVWRRNSTGFIVPTPEETNPSPTPTIQQNHPSATPTPKSPTVTPVPPTPTIVSPTATSTPTSTPFPGIPCPTDGSSNVYTIISVPGPHPDIPAAEHPDLNLQVRGYIPTDKEKNLIDINGPADQKAPQLSGVLGRLPVFSNVYKVYDWDWQNNRRGGAISYPDVTLLGLTVTMGENIAVPDSGYFINGNFQALVLYADENNLTLKYTLEDNVVSGYTAHIAGFCTDSNLLRLYRQQNAAGRNSLPLLFGRQNIGTANNDEVSVAIRTNGSFMDPRSRKDWWKGY